MFSPRILSVEKQADTSVELTVTSSDPEAPGSQTYKMKDQTACEKLLQPLLRMTKEHEAGSTGAPRTEKARELLALLPDAAAQKQAPSGTERSAWLVVQSLLKNG